MKVKLSGEPEGLEPEDGWSHINKVSELLLQTETGFGENSASFSGSQKGQKLQSRAGDGANETNEEPIGWTGRARRQVSQQRDAKKSHRGHVTGVLAHSPP